MILSKKKVASPKIMGEFKLSHKKKGNLMKSLKKFIIWICKRFSRQQIMQIIIRLIEIIEEDNLESENPQKIKQQYPNYRNFFVDSELPIEFKDESTLDYKTLLKNHLQNIGRSLKPVHPKNIFHRPPERIKCPHCNAPYLYIYYNNGKKCSQYKCKVCKHTFKKYAKERKSKYICPYCGKVMYKWKHNSQFDKYKCGNHNCKFRLKRLTSLSPEERKLRHEKESQFQINYIFTEYHFKPKELQLPEVEQPVINLNKAYCPSSIIGLVLTYYVSFALSSWKTALIMRQVHSVTISHQTVLNYVKTAAFYCHNFNLRNKGSPEHYMAGDETYIKVGGIQNYIWFFMGVKSKRIFAYHLSESRETQHAIIAINEALRNRNIKKRITLITDGNPSYQAGLNYLKTNSDTQLKVTLRNVIGLQNIDKESTYFRPYKEMIERLNRTYKYHVKPGTGYATFNTAFAHLVLFVTHYNYLRPHMALNYSVPIDMQKISSLPNIQNQWMKIISLA